MAQAIAQQVNDSQSRSGVRMAVVVWILTAVFYFYQYAMRSAPAVMMPQLSATFGVSALGVASIVGLFYYGYSFGWILLRVSGGAAKMELSHYQFAFRPLLYGVAIAIVLALLLKETGPAARKLVTGSN